MSEGYIKLHRSIQEHWLWQNKPFSEGQAWIDLLLLANHEDIKIPYKGEIIICARGTVNRSILSLAERWKWDRKTVRHFLELLENDKMCTTNITKHRTTITIVNYGFYQDVGTTKCTTACTTKSQQSPINNNDNNIKEILPKGSIKKAEAFRPPSIDEVKSYCLERGNKVDADRWYDFYSAKGWMIGKNKMKDWKAAVRTWEKDTKKTDKKPSKNQFNEMIHTDYDFDELERRLTHE